MFVQIRGLYRGVSAPLLGVTPIFATCFWGYEIGKQLVRFVNNKAPEEQLNIEEVMFAGGFSAIPTTVSAICLCVRCAPQVTSLLLGIRR